MNQQSRHNHVLTLYYIFLRFCFSIFVIFCARMSAYAVGAYTGSPLIRSGAFGDEPVQLRARTLGDLSRSFCVGDTSPSANTASTYRMRSWAYRTFRQSRLDDVFYPDQHFQFSSAYRPYPVIDKYERRDHSSVPYTYWSRGKMDCLYPSDQPDLYRRSHEGYRDEYSYKVWSGPRRELLRDV